MMTNEMNHESGGFKSGFVALMGKPNVGKSTLLNHYMGQKIAAVSYKPQTTRKRQLGIFTNDQAQIIFIDTPGFHAGDFKLSAFINQEAQYALTDADLILFIVDVSHFPDREDLQLVDEIKQKAGDIPCLLVMNKVDLAEPETLMQHTKAYQDLLDFNDTIHISAVTEVGRQELLNRMIEFLDEGPRYYPDGQITVTYERDIAEDLIRASALNYLRDEVPYSIFVLVNEYAKRQDGTRYVNATIFVERDSQKGIVIGKGGSMIKKISTLARQEIEEMSGEPVYLDLSVKVEKNWRNNPDFLRRYGLSHD